MTPTAFVAGASGYTGRAVVAELRRRGLRTVAHVRPGSASLAEVGPRFEALGAEVDSTPWEPEAMTGTLRRLRPDLVFSLLGTTRKRARAEGMEAAEGYERVDYGLTALLIDAAVASGARPRFVYLSSLGADRPEGNAYLEARARAEAKLRASGLPYTVARPSFITGPDREESRPLERLAAGVADAHLGLGALLGARRLRDRYRSRSAAEVARSLVDLALDPEAEDRVYESHELPAPGRP